MGWTAATWAGGRPALLEAGLFSTSQGHQEHGGIWGKECGGRWAL